LKTSIPPARAAYNWKANTLRGRPERPRCRAAEQRDEVAPPQVEGAPFLPVGHKLRARSTVLSACRSQGSGPWVRAEMFWIGVGAPRAMQQEKVYFTSSARPSSGSGAVIPSALAVCRLRTNSSGSQVGGSRLWGSL
jgi:hypothetical protein